MLTTWRTVRGALGLTLVGCAAACLQFDAFSCTQSAQCDLGGVGGVCQPTGYCSYPDPTCPTLQRYDENAGDGLAGQCVGSEVASATDTDVSTGTSSDPSGPTSGETTTTTGGSDPTTDPTMTGSTSETEGGGCGQYGQACCEPDATCEPSLSCSEGTCSCVTTIAAGHRHNCLITQEGRVLCWGANDQGQLGMPGEPFETVPVDVSPAFGGAGTAATAISATHQSCALREDGVAYCWGANALGQAAPGEAENPIQATSVAAFAPTSIGVATGETFSCVARTDGTALTCFGDNASGQLTGAESGPGPVDVPAIFEFAEVELGQAHGCGRTATGDMYCWGSNSHGQLGLDPVLTPSSATLQQIPLPPVADIAVGAQHTCARASNVVHCWGRNDVGQLGNGTQNPSFDPLNAASLPMGVAVASLEAGTHHACAALIGGGLLCWGSNDRGQLLLEPDDTGFDGYTLVPVEVDVGANVDQVAAGQTHTCVLTDTGQVLCWGANTEGQIGNGLTSLQVFEPTAVEVTCP